MSNLWYLAHSLQPLASSRQAVQSGPVVVTQSGAALLPLPPLRQLHLHGPPALHLLLLLQDEGDQGHGGRGLQGYQGAGNDV